MEKTMEKIDYSKELLNLKDKIIKALENINAKYTETMENKETYTLMKTRQEQNAFNLGYKECAIETSLILQQLLKQYE